ncbi:MAG: RNA methyltransferase [Cryomorphaceae bacterium]|nr:RNA methyltransferase [Cryomorphaceae bacterium]
MISKNQIKFIKSLSLKKNRVKAQLFVAEGEKIVNELLNSNLEIEHIYATKQFSAINRCQKSAITLITNDELLRISNLTSPNNVLAIVKISQKESEKSGGIKLVLDDVNDPGNLGTIIRMCDWFGVTQLICSNSTVDCYNAKVVQSAMGSLFKLDIKYLDLATYLADIDTPIYGAYMNGVDVKGQEFPKQAHLIMGNEANGISESISKYITNKVSIKNIGGNTESLNVAVATSILLHEFCS